MRVLFVTWVAPGHLNHMVPLAWACQAAGHDVRVAGPPSCQEAIMRAGLPAVSVGTDVATAVLNSRPELAPWRRRGRWPAGWGGHPELLDDGQLKVVAALADKQFQVADAMLDDLIGFGRWWRPQVVVYDFLCWAGVVAGTVLGVPAFAHTHGTAATIPRAEMRDMATEPLPGFVRLFERFGAEPGHGPVGWFEPCPPSLRLPDRLDSQRIPIRYVPYNGPGAVPGWLLAEPSLPRVCVTGGVSGDTYRPETTLGLLRSTVTAICELDVEVIVAVSQAQEQSVGELPAKTRVVRAIPFQLLLPSCRAVVHHGGAGTGLSAIHAGIPQLVLPQAPQLAELGDRLHARGAGIMLSTETQDDPGSIRAAVSSLLTEPRYATATREILAEMAAMPTPSARVGLLEDAAAGRAPVQTIAAATPL